MIIYIGLHRLCRSDHMGFHVEGVVDEETSGLAHKAKA